MSDPVAFKKYWHEWMDHIATATRQAPAEIGDAWSVGHAPERRQKRRCDTHPPRFV